MHAPMRCLCARASSPGGRGLQVGPADVRSGSVPQRRAMTDLREEEKKEGGGAAASGNQGQDRAQH